MAAVEASAQASIVSAMMADITASQLELNTFIQTKLNTKTESTPDGEFNQEALLEVITKINSQITKLTTYIASVASASAAGGMI